MAGIAFGVALGGLILLLLAAGTRSAGIPRPTDGPPGTGYSKGAAETRYQRRRVAKVGVGCLIVATGLAIAAATIG